MTPAMELYQLGTLLLALGSLLAVLLGVGGAVVPALDIINNFTPLILVGSLAALLLEAAFKTERAPATFISAAFAAFISLALMAPELIAGAAQARVAPERQTIKVIQHNLWSLNTDPAGTARWLIAQHADVLVLEEVVDKMADMPERLKAAYPYRSACDPSVPCTTLILSREPQVASGAWPAPDADGLHSAAWATIGRGADAFTVVGDHAPWPLPKNHQQTQSALLASRLEGFDKAGLIVGGDFNSTGWSFSLRRQDHLFGLIRRSRALFSFPVRPYSHWRFTSPLPILPIDQLYAGSSWKTVSVQAAPRTGSDHLPIVAVLTR